MKKIFLLILSSSITFALFAGNINDTIYNVVNKGITFNLTKDKKYFVKLGVHGQIWSRFMQLNPGTVDYNGTSVKTDADILLRRTCMSYYVHLDNFTFFSMIALTAQPHTSSLNGSAPFHPQLFFYDAWGSYDFANGKFIAGGGLNMYNGISRASSASSMRSLGADVPLIAAPNLTSTEQAARQLSIFATGNINSFAYRIAVAKPFVCNTIPDNIIPNTIYNLPNHNYSFKGYFEYQIFDKESNKMPFKPATYIGEKKILNIGAGFDFQPDATVMYSETDIETKYNKLHFAVDAFVDYPFANKSAVTFYASQFWFNYGPNYTQSFGIVDIYKNGTSEYQFGTGNSTFLQIAYLLPAKQKSNRLQPYYEFTLRNFDGANKKLYHHNVGINYFVIGHKLKFSLQYENRPYVNGNSIERKSLIIGKMQFSI